MNGDGFAFFGFKGFVLFHGVRHELDVAGARAFDGFGGFAPDFAHYNDDVLFGENWNNQDIDLKTRSLITVISLMS